MAQLIMSGSRALWQLELRPGSLLHSRRHQPQVSGLLIACSHLGTCEGVYLCTPAQQLTSKGAESSNTC
jgi:hypothetical protein